MLLDGIFLPITTPFYPDGRLYLRKLESNVEHYSRTPAAGMLVLGESGEADALTDEETRLVLESAIGAAAKERVMIAAVGRESVFATLALAGIAAEAGYDAIAVRGPAFASDESMKIELMTYFRAVADGASVPVVLVSSSDRPLSVDLLAELADHPQVIGVVNADASPERVRAIKDRTAGVSREVTVTTVFAAATRRMLAAAEGAFASRATLGGVAVLEAKPALKTRMKRVGFQVLVGSTKGMLEAWQAGASGAVPRLGACAPQACCEVWQAFRDEDPALAEEKQDRVRKIAGRMEGASGIGAIKYGCDFNGYYGGRPRLPLLGLTAAESAEVERELVGMRN
jgi:dihydrodipicolinate synthase/N-acetylneuraminate lyase